jgi:hypothetical protein
MKEKIMLRERLVGKEQDFWNDIGYIIHLLDIHMKGKELIKK